ncbi:hypothetical protein KCP76_14005 [Salmonella enterica subsp. enterica serovar Weltevreden]|nr:hypothetical protein KCP76_14005 [Salmonella enterica subsp. enterica serovar Weltevreden]
MQYDAILDSVATSSSNLEYRRDQDRLVQLNYPYASPEYIQGYTLPSYYSRRNQYKNGINGGRGDWQVGRLPSRWSIVGAYYFDTNSRQTCRPRCSAFAVQLLLLCDPRRIRT